MSNPASLYSVSVPGRPPDATAGTDGHLVKRKIKKATQSGCSSSAASSILPSAGGDTESGVQTVYLSPDDKARLSREKVAKHRRRALELKQQYEKEKLEGGRTPLHKAVVDDNLSECKLIIENVEDKNPKGLEIIN